MSRFVSLNERYAPEDLGFAHGRLDRAGDRRDDGRFLTGALASGNAGIYALVGETVVLKTTDPLGALFSPAELPLAEARREQVFLGLDGDAPRFGVLLEDTAAERLAAIPGLALISLRQCAIEGLLPPDQLGALATAKALLHWHQTHRFCARCGAPSHLRQAGWRRDCDNCGAQHFPRTDPVVIMLAIRGQSCLLGRQPRFLPGMYSCLAGFCEPGETIEDAVRREIKEEAGIEIGRVRYLASQPWPFPQSLMIGCIAEAQSETITRDVTELEDARWFTRAEVLAMMARKHPEAVHVPAKFSLASQLVQAWAVEGIGL
ncbi:MAG TPA: NAD(+) diphosphatase [Beijerinckiaceae bacterium]|nr:NAD(+) diphosphatase [Beijerinckiaceae bacterium]